MKYPLNFESIYEHLLDDEVFTFIRGIRFSYKKALELLDKKYYVFWINKSQYANELIDELSPGEALYFLGDKREDISKGIKNKDIYRLCRRAPQQRLIDNFTSPEILQFMILFTMFGRIERCNADGNDFYPELEELMGKMRNGKRYFCHLAIKRIFKYNLFPFFQRLREDNLFREVETLDLPVQPYCRDTAKQIKLHKIILLLRMVAYDPTCTLFAPDGSASLKYIYNKWIKGTEK